MSQPKYTIMNDREIESYITAQIEHEEEAALEHLEENTELCSDECFDVTPYEEFEIRFPKGFTPVEDQIRTFDLRDYKGKWFCYRTVRANLFRQPTEGRHL